MRLSSGKARLSLMRYGNIQYRLSMRANVAIETSEIVFLLASFGWEAYGISVCFSILGF
jgi:hypothetical protein